MKDRDLDDLFNDVLAAWDEPDAHTAFLEIARRRHQLARASTLYRAEKEAHPERAEVVDKRQAAIVLLATQALQATSEPPPTINKSTWLTIGAIFMGVAAYCIKRALFG